MAVYKEDILSVDISKGRLARSRAAKVLGLADIKGDKIGVAIYNNGQAVSLSGVQCQGYFIRSSGDTVVITGQISGNTGYVILPQACYVYEGPFTLAIKLAGGGVTGTLRIIDGVVTKTTTDTLIDPGTTVPDLSQLLAIIDEAESAADAANDAAEAASAAAESANTVAENITDIAFCDIDPSDVVSGYIMQNGTYNSSDNFQICKYEVMPGETLRLDIEFPYASSGGVYQFQNNASVPYNTNNYIVGETVTEAFSGFVTVPEGATWLMVVRQANTDNNKISRSALIGSNALYEYNAKTNDAVVTGYIMQNGTYNSNANYQIKKYAVSAGDALYVHITNPYTSSGGVYQFQNNENVPYNTNNYIVGNTKTDGYTGSIVVPEGATWLMVVSKAGDDKNWLYTLKVRSNLLDADDEAIREKIINFKRDSMQYRKGNTSGSWYDRFVLFHVSDNHIGTSFARRNLAELSEVTNAMAPDAVVNSGDMTDGGTQSTTPATVISQFNNFTALFTDKIDAAIPIIATLGNHDANDISVEAYANATTKQMQWDNVFAAIAQKYSDIVWGDATNYKHYCYLDIIKGSYTIRIISLDGLDHPDYTSAGLYNGQWREVYSQDQISWLCNTALNVPANYGVIIVNHFPFAPRLSAYSEEWPALNDGYFAQGWDMIPQIVKAWENRESISKTFADDTGSQDITVSADFSSIPQSAMFVCYMVGHTHSKNAFEVKAEGGTNYHQLMLCEDSSGQQGSALNRVYKYDDVVQNTAASQITIDMHQKRVYRTAYDAYQKCSEAPNGSTEIFGFSPCSLSV